MLTIVEVTPGQYIDNGSQCVSGLHSACGNRDVRAGFEPIPNDRSLTSDYRSADLLFSAERDHTHNRSCIGHFSVVRDLDGRTESSGCFVDHR